MNVNNLFFIKRPWVNLTGVFVFRLDIDDLDSISFAQATVSHYGV
jgi:hypothetical protein